MSIHEENPGAEAGVLDTVAAQEAFGASSVDDRADTDCHGGGEDGHTNRLLSFAELLTVLGYHDDEFVSVCHKIGKNGTFQSAVMPPGEAEVYVASLPTDEADVWFGVNPVRGPARKNAGRGSKADVTRLAALVADLDVKPGWCPDLDTAHKILDDVSSRIGQRPVAVTFSGHGLQPYWPVTGGHIGEGFTTEQAKALLDRFKQLVKDVAQQHDCKVDSVFDLPRILRVPGTFNCKDIW